MSRIVLCGQLNSSNARKSRTVHIFHTIAPEKKSVATRWPQWARGCQKVERNTICNYIFLASIIARMIMEEPGGASDGGCSNSDIPADVPESACDQRESGCGCDLNSATATSLPTFLLHHNHMYIRQKLVHCWISRSHHPESDPHTCRPFPRSLWIFIGYSREKIK